VTELLADLLVRDADHVVTMDDARVEISGGWVAIDGGFVTAVGGPADDPPAATRTLSARGCLVTPGLVNTHHHLYQNLARAYAPVTNVPFAQWLETLLPLWTQLDEEAVYAAAWIGLAELALGGGTCSTDHLYLDPFGDGRLIDAEIEAAADLGFRFHPTHGSLDLTTENGGWAPPALGLDPDRILGNSERLVARHHDPSPGAMCRLALAPSATFQASEELYAATNALAERLDVRLHTHLVYTPDEDPFCLDRYGVTSTQVFERAGWGTDRTWIAHALVATPEEIAAFGRWGLGVAHCPSSTMLAGGGITPVRELLDAGARIGLGVDGSASTDAASLWLEARQALLMCRYRKGTTSFSARDALEAATRGGAACLGREGELGVLQPGAAGDLVCWPREGIAFAGAHTDPVEAWLRCGPVSARHTVVAGELIVEDGHLRHPGLDDRLARHARVAKRLQGVDGT
jgi:cytosine/adenosine deaminase-related metal-dependent hydrolase